MTTKVSYLTRNGRQSLAYMHISGSSPGAVFYPGFLSDMNSAKANFFMEHFQKRGVAFTKFDYSGIGMSKVNNENPHVMLDSFDKWVTDSLDIFDTTQGPQILIGSSMGGWLASRVAMERPDRVAGLVFIGPAADFLDGLYEKLDPSLKAELEKGETVQIPRQGDPFMRKSFIDDQKPHRLLDRKSIPVRCPVRILHGMADESVPWEKSLELCQKFESSDVDVVFRKIGQHRLCEPDDLRLLGNAVDQLLETLQIRAQTG